MANIRNLQILKTFTDFFKLKAFDSFGDVVGRMIVPVVNVPIPPATIQVLSGLATDATSATIHTTSATADTFLIAAQISVAKDVNSTAIFSRILATPFGKTNQNFVMLRYEPLTAGDSSEFNPLPFPVKLERNTTVTVTNDAGVASIDTTGIIFFYEIED